MNLNGLKRFFSNKRLLPLLILLIALFFTGLASSIVYSDARADYNNRLDRMEKRIQQTIESRIRVYTDALVHTRSFLQVSDKIKRPLFAQFTEGMQLHDNYPGILALCYIKKIASSDMPKHLKQVHAEGFTNYKVWPESNLDLRTSIYFIEPFNETNQRAFGFDMMTEPNRREAMLAAQDLGVPTVTRKIILVQDKKDENSDDQKFGFIIFVPIYKPGLPVNTIEERRAALTGFVSSPFRAEELFSQILREENYLRNMVTFKVFDGTDVDNIEPLFSPATLATSLPNENHRYSSIQVANQHWTILIQPLPPFGSDSTRNSQWYVLFLGCITSLLLYLLALSSYHHNRTLLSSKNQLRLITDTLPALVSYIDTQLRYRFVNKVYLNWFGRSEADYLGRTAREIFGQGIDDATLKIRKLAVQGETSTIETTIKNNKLGLRQVQVQYIPDRQDDEVQGVVILATDITDQRAAEQKIKEQSRTFEVINQVVLSLQAETDVKNIAQLVTDSGTEVTQAQFGAFFYTETLSGDTQTYAFSEVLQKNLKNFQMPENIFTPTFSFAGEKIIRIDDVTKCDIINTNFLFKDLLPRHLPVRSYLVVPVISRSKEVLGILYFGHAEAGIFTDHSEKVILGIAAQAAVALDSARLYENLKLSERHSSHLAQRQAYLAEAGQIISSALDQRTVLKNLAEFLVPRFSEWCQIFMLNSKGTIEQITVSCRDPLKAGMLTQLNQTFPPKLSSNVGPGHVIRTGQAEHYYPLSEATLELMSENNEHFELLKKLEIKSYISVPLNHREKIIGCMKLALTSEGQPLNEDALQFTKDLARRVSLAMDNAELYAEAQKLNRIKDEFLTTLSHELRTPLNIILGHSEILKTETDLAKSDIFYSLDAIHRNALVQNQIISDLLDSSAIMTGKISFEPIVMNPIQIILEATENIRFAAENKGLILTFKSEDPGLLIISDSLRLQQIISNLLSNAVKFTPSKGEINVQIRSSDQHAIIEVIDSGQGMDAHFLPYIFDRFRQEDSSLTRNFGGLGLGLSLVRQLIELHGGSIEVQSAGKGLGSLFRVLIPRAF